MIALSGKVLATAASGVIGIALAGGATFAASGALTSADVAGQVLPVDGVGTTIDAESNLEANVDSDLSIDSSEVAVEGSAGVSTGTSADATTSDDSTSDSTSAEAAANGSAEVEVVAPGAAVSLDVTGSAGVND